jgi:hypothetical protein
LTQINIIIIYNNHRILPYLCIYLYWILLTTFIMKRTLLLSFAITACLLSQTFAQTYTPTYSTKIILKNGNKLTILPPTFAADFSMTLPNANASGVLTNDGSGALSWAAATPDLSQALILAPTTSARNVIQPTAATVVPLTAKGLASQSANLQEWQNSDGTVLASITSSGLGSFENGLSFGSGNGLSGVGGASIGGVSSLYGSTTNGYQLNVQNFTAGGGTSGGIYVNLPTAKVAGTNNGIEFNVVGGAGTSNDMLGTASTWKVTNAGAFTLNGLSASSIVTTDASKTLTSVPNGTGVLTNNGSGVLSWAVATSGWALTGNAGTSYGTNFVGTTDASELMFKVAGQISGRIEHLTPFATSIGYQALNVNTGVYNTAVGHQALYSNTIGGMNTASGASALFYNTSGSSNTASGVSTLEKNTSGSGNTAIGASALAANTTGGSNTASGRDALAFNSLGSNNTASGVASLQVNTTASQNVAIGKDALRTQSFSNGSVAWNSNNTAVGFEALRNNQPTSTSDGINNTATGSGALRTNTTGSSNTGLGFQALFSNTTGTDNTASGLSALFFNTTGIRNTASGEAALYTNTTGTENAALGVGALYFNSMGSFNTGIGVDALVSNTIGSNNTALGRRAGNLNTTGSNNTFIGYHADASASALTNATAIGNGAVVDASNKIQLGNANVTLVSTEGDYQTGLGDKVIFRNPAGTFNSTFKAGAQLVALDYTLPLVAPSAGQVLSSTATGELSWATAGGAGWATNGNALTGTLPATPTEFFGSTNGADVIMRTNSVEQMRLRSAGGVNIPSTTAAGVGVVFQNGNRLLHSFGPGNFFAGYNAGNLTMSGSGNNTAIGSETFQSNTTGQYNTALGVQTLYINTTGNHNTAIGTFALGGNTSGTSNTAVGVQALTSNSTGGLNTAVGFEALRFNTTGNYNSSFGGSALLLNTKGDNNIAIGNNAMRSNTTASNNLAIGNDALRTQSFSNANAQWNSNNTALGYEALYSNQPTTTSNGINNTATGYHSLRANTTGFGNVASGYQALRANTSGTNNTASGYQALQTNTSGNYNAAFGDNALNLNSTGTDNAAVGSNALKANTSGTSNSAYGGGALFTNTTGFSNTAVGYLSLESNTTGDHNSALGRGANVGAGALTNATAIGAYAIVVASNSIQLGSTSVTLVTTEGDYQTGLGDKVIFRNPAGTFNSTINAGAQLATIDYTLPLSAPTEVGQVLAVATSGAASTLEWTGSPRGAVSAKTAAYTAVASDRFLFVSNAGAAYNITLPTAANKGQLITVTKTDANTNAISVVAAAGQTLVQIGARATLSGQAYSVTLAADGTTTWYVVAHEAPDPAAVFFGTNTGSQGN